MKVYVNNRVVVVYEGARVKDAINKYYSDLLIEGSKESYSIKVHDDHGNPVMIDGSLSENDHIYIEVC
jgi:hypothetical protein